LLKKVQTESSSLVLAQLLPSAKPELAFPEDIEENKDSELLELAFKFLLSDNAIQSRPAMKFFIKLFTDSETKLHFTQLQVAKIINFLLKLSETKGNVHVREEALECLTLMAVFLPEYRILPHASEVIHSVRNKLSDHKRVVRIAAVKCNNTWACYTSLK